MERSQLLIDLMMSYGKRGIAGWNAVGNENKREVVKRIGWKIAGHPAELKSTIGAYFSDETMEVIRFIPLYCDENSFEFKFFLPIRDRVDGADDKFSFELFLIVDQDHCLGFRWEPAHSDPSIHQYGHVQMNRRMVRKYADAFGIPPWLPSSSPAIPTSTSDPLHLFLSMAIAVSGYGDQFKKTLFRMFPEATKTRAYLSEVKRLIYRIDD